MLVNCGGRRNLHTATSEWPAHFGKGGQLRLWLVYGTIGARIMRNGGQDGGSCLSTS